MKNITEKLISLTSDYRLSQADLAKIAGVSEASVSAWMRGAKPRRRYLLKIADELGLDVISLEDDSLDIKKREGMPLAKGDSLLDAYLGISNYDILAELSDIIDQIDESENEEETVKQIINELSLNLIRRINGLSSIAIKQSESFFKSNDNLRSSILHTADQMIVLAYSLGQCARYIPSDKFKTIIHNIRRYSVLQKEKL